MNAITEFLREQTKQEQQREAVEAFLQPHVLSAQNPHWEELKPGSIRVHDWRTHIPSPLQGDAWNSLSLETRTALVAMASDLADREEHE